MPEGAEADKKAPAALTEREAKQLRDELIDAYLRYADLADDTITRTNRARAEAVIWSNMDREEAAILADLAIMQGMRSAIAAQAVRGMVRSSKYVAAGMIVGKRAWDTLVFYARNGGIVLWL